MNYQMILCNAYVEEMRGCGRAIEARLAVTAVEPDAKKARLEGSKEDEIVIGDDCKPMQLAAKARDKQAHSQTSVSSNLRCSAPLRPENSSLPGHCPDCCFCFRLF